MQPEGDKLQSHHPLASLSRRETSFGGILASHPKEIAGLATFAAVILSRLFPTPTQAAESYVEYCSGRLIILGRSDIRTNKVKIVPRIIRCSNHTDTQVTEAQNLFSNGNFVQQVKEVGDYYKKWIGLDMYPDTTPPVVVKFEDPFSTYRNDVYALGAAQVRHALYLPSDGTEYRIVSDYYISDTDLKEEQVLANPGSMGGAEQKTGYNFIPVFLLKNTAKYLTIKAHEDGHSLGLRHPETNPQKENYDPMWKERLMRFDIVGSGLTLATANLDKWNIDFITDLSMPMQTGTSTPMATMPSTATPTATRTAVAGGTMERRLFLQSVLNAVSGK